jgi:hypothetical protein
MLSRIKARPPAALAAVQELSLEVAGKTGDDWLSLNPFDVRRMFGSAMAALSLQHV